MAEQTQQHSYREEHDTLQDDTIKTPAVRPLSTKSPTPPISKSPAHNGNGEKAATPAAKPLSKQEMVIDDEDDTMDDMATAKMPAFKKRTAPFTTIEGSRAAGVAKHTSSPVIEKPKQATQNIPDTEKSGSFLEIDVDIIDMTQEQEQPALQEQTEEPTLIERAVVLSTIAATISTIATAVTAELVTTLSAIAQIKQTEEATPSSVQEIKTPLAPSEAAPLEASALQVEQIEHVQSIQWHDTPDANVVTTLWEPTVPIVDTPLPQETALRTEKPTPVPIARVELPTTPQTIDTFIPITPIATSPPEQRKTRTSVVQRRPPRLSLWRKLLAAFFSVLLIGSFVLLWSDLTSTHLLITTLDPGNGSVRLQQDIASYHDSPSLTTPLYGSSSISVGLHNDALQNGTHHLFVFANNNGQWSAKTQFSSLLAGGTVQLSADGLILTTSIHTLQVRSADGHLLWTTVSDQPASGVHRFHPVSDSHTLYTIKSLSQSQIVAYDLHSGQTNWVQTLDDTIDYAPPFLLGGGMLYIASNQNIYALNSSDGTLRWQQPYPSRTLLFVRQGQQGQTPLLIAAGTRGLVALDPTTGQAVWTFRGQASDSLTATEFYQATEDTNNITTPLIYTTGIVWRIPQVQEQVWLYAVDARTGTQVWAKRVDDGFASVDAGRIFPPLLDTTHHLVLLQQQVSTDTQRIATFDATNGAVRWSTTIKNNSTAIASLLQLPDGTLLLFRTLTNSTNLLWIFSPLRFLSIVTILGSIVVLCMVLFFPFYDALRYFIARSQHVSLSPPALYPHKSAKSGSTRLWLVVLLLTVCIGTCLISYVRLNQVQEHVYQIAAHAGSTEWQQTTTHFAQPLLADAQGSVMVVSNDNHLSQVQSLTSAGTVNWQTFLSNGTFSTPIASPRAGRLLVTLSGRSMFPYQFAPDDPAYQHPIDHFLSFYLFDRASGTILWQHVAISPAEQQQGVVLGADEHDFYVVSTPLATLQSTGGAAVQLQLTAINQETGIVDWHVFGPPLSAAVQDSGTLLLHNGLAIWQVRGIVYAIDSAIGQIVWRHPLQSDTPAVLAQEEQQELAAPGTLFVTRLDGVHALDLASGNELWHLPGLGVATAQSRTGFALAGHTLLMYGSGQLEAFDVQNHQNLWSQKQLGSIANLHVSDDGTLLYMLLPNTVQGSTPAPAVVALDTQTGSIRWTFPLLGQTPINSGSFAGFLYSRGTLFVISCTTTETAACSSQHLYALDGNTGKTNWKVGEMSISDLKISADGSILLFHATSTAWEDFLARLQN